MGSGLDISTVVPLVLGSSLIASIINHFVVGYRDRRKERKELVARASASVLKRVELCYRIRRRADGEDTKIKNLVHDVQEENEYYRCLLRVESRWYGDRYSLYLESVKELTGASMSKAWKKQGNPSADMEDDIKLNHKKLDRLSKRFSLDSRRFLCPVRRFLIAIHDRIWEVTKYDV